MSKRTRVTLGGLSLGLVCLQLLGAGAASAGFGVIKEGDCDIKLVWNLQFFGATADSAFAEKVRNAIVGCWSDVEYQCCSVEAVVNVKVGLPTRCAGYDSVVVVDETEKEYQSKALVSDGTGEDFTAWFGNDEPDATYAHEALHLAGLHDHYKRLKKSKIVKGEIVDFEEVIPCPGFENDKLATLSGMITPFIVNSIIEKSSVFCNQILCCPDDIPSAYVSSGLESVGPPVPPTMGGLEFELVTPTGGTAILGFRQPSGSGGGSTFTVMAGSFTIALDPLVYEPRPDAPAGVFPGAFVDVQFLADSFEWTPGNFTGDNELSVATELVPPGLISPSVVQLVDNGGGSQSPGTTAPAAGSDGDFSGIMGLKWVNDLFPAGSPAYFEATVFGNVNYMTGNGYFGIADTPLFFLSNVGTPPGDGNPPFRLAGNYPNPVRSHTNIAFQLDRGADTTLRIFDVTGRLVRTVVSGRLPRGTYSYRWDRTSDEGRPVTSGVYFTVLTAGERRDSRRLVLLP